MKLYKSVVVYMGYMINWRYMINGRYMERWDEKSWCDLDEINVL